jgi:CubicO group peptidase (beta-lactamase class C family)
MTRKQRLLAAGALAALTLGFAACSPATEEAPATVAAAPQPVHATAAATLGLPVAAAADLGYSVEGLDRMTAGFRSLVDGGKLAGVTTVLSRHGKIVHWDTYGKANATTGDALNPDSIFRIASMTKPIAGVAMMQLYEQGKWAMDDPVAKHIPEFAKLRVKNAGGGTEPQKTPMTMAQLMSHSAGFGVSAVYQDAALSDSNLQGMIDKLAKLPLETQPGTAWDYGPSVNIHGYLVEKLSGQPLDVYLQENIFAPLGMVDTGFWTPPEKAARVVAIHTYDADGKIMAAETQRVVTEKPAFLSGSGGLVSTARDYWRFSQAMLNGGELDGARILKAETVALMRQNVLNPGVMLDLYGPDQPGIGFGMDFAVVMDPAAASTKQGLNTFYWGGAFGTWFWIDPTNDVVFVGMIQNMEGSRPDKGTPQVRPMSVDWAYTALADTTK